MEQLPSKRFRARYYHDGRWIKADGVFATKADANAWLSNAESDIRKGVWIDPALSRETLSVYAKNWLGARSDLAPSTRAKYEHLLKNHILPTLGESEIGRITAGDVRKWYHRLGVKYKTTANDAYRCLRAIINTAVADEHIARSPMTVKGAGGVATSERPVISVAEANAVVEAIPSRYRAAVVLAAWCQLRIGEVLALQRRHVENGEVEIDQAWSTPMGGPRTLKGPKTEAGLRTIGIPEYVLPMIEDHVKTYVGPNPTDWLFPTANGTAISARNFTRAWDKARKAIGRPELHFHDLRHTGLTWSAASGASLSELMHRGGHASPRAAIRYQHATKDQDRALTAALSKLAASP